MVSERFYEAGELVGVLTTEPLGRILDYKAPDNGCGDGDFVEVPLGPRRVIGVVWGKGEGKFDPAKIRSVVRVLDVPPMRAELRAFLTRAAEYTLTPMSAMLMEREVICPAELPPNPPRPLVRTPVRMTKSSPGFCAPLRLYSTAPPPGQAWKYTFP